MIIQRKSSKTGASTAARVAGFPCWRRTSNVRQFSRQLLACKIVLLFGNISEHKSFEFIVAMVGMCVTFLKLPVKFRHSNKSWRCGKVKHQYAIFQILNAYTISSKLLIARLKTNPESKIQPIVQKYFDVLLQNFEVSLFSKTRLFEFESDFSAMDCAVLYRREIRLELLEIIELRQTWSKRQILELL